MDTLPLHELQEYEDEFEYSDADIVDILKSNRVEIKERLSALESDINLIVSLESLSTKCLNSKYLTPEIISSYNSLVEQDSLRLQEYKQVSLESFDTLLIRLLLNQQQLLLY
jgi:hypothetical protein